MNYSKTILFSCIGILILVITSCGESEQISPIPEISFLGFSKDTMVQSNFNLDTIQFSIAFTDGDGDLNRLEDNLGAKIIITDLRTNALYDRFLLPNIPSSGKVTGEMFVRLFSTCCVFPDNIPPCSINEKYPTNELALQIVLQDGSGNNSNKIETPPIMLLCK
tara:strand:+ start:2955 stop:3446 length:492 start_codon:yes stop_codon:yes gene_type:complete